MNLRYLLMTATVIGLGLTACVETKVVSPSPTVVAPSPTVRIVSPSPTVIVLEPTPPTPSVTLTVNSVRFVAQSYDDVVIDITIGNMGGTDLFYSTSQFRAVDSEGFTHPAEPPGFRGTGVPRGYLRQPLFDGILGPGEKVSGDFPFDVPAGTLRLLIWSPPGLPEIAVELP